MNIHSMKGGGTLLKESFSAWYNRDPFRSSAVISYYTIFSLPGLFVIVINLAGYFYGTEALTNQVSAQIADVIGTEEAQQIEGIIANAYTGGGLTWSSIISIATLIFGATGVFYQVQQDLNRIWKVQPSPDRMILNFLRERLISFGMILAIGFLLLVSLIISSLISSFSNWLSINFFGLIDELLKLVDIVISLGVITLLFAAIFKILPDAKIRWGDVWIGAFITSILFVIAKFLLGLYFGYSDPGSIYGAAGSIILIMLWTTYSGIILLFGAEFTCVYTKHKGRKIEAEKYAIPLDEPEKE
ncbi:MAG TPA: YihY/virulence factor BrkB family protein [Balneolaceae bacterium]